jgi:hypothetical protein
VAVTALVAVAVRVHTAHEQAISENFDSTRIVFHDRSGAVIDQFKKIDRRKKIRNRICFCTRV